MIKKHISILLAVTIIFSLLPQMASAERILPEKTNAYTDYDPQRGLNWLSNEELVASIVKNADKSNSGDDTIYKLAKGSLIIHVGKTYGYINGFRTDMSDYPTAAKLIDNTVYVPLKFMDLSVSGNAVYDESAGVVTVSDSGKTVSCTPLVENGIVFVPVREVYESGLGKKVIYAGNGAIIVTTSSLASLVTDDIRLKVADPGFYIEREKMVHPFDAIRWVIHESSVRGFATQGASWVRTTMNNYLGGTNISDNYIADKNLSDRYPADSRTLSNLLTMSYAELADYVDYTAQYYTYAGTDGTEKKRIRHIGERSSYERAAGYMARLYELNPSEDLALRIIIMLYHTALRFDYLDTKVREDSSFYNYDYVTPTYLVYAYDKVYHSPMWENFKAGYAVDGKAVVNKYFRTIYNYISANRAGDTISNYPLIMEHMAGIGVALDDPDILRFVISKLNAAVNPISFYADGMWYEGSTDYGSQMVGHAYAAARIIKAYRDRRCYTDDIFGLDVKLDAGLDTAGRWTDFFDYVDSLKGDSFTDTALRYPDGSPVAVNDIHWQNTDSNLSNNTIKVEDFSKNIELNHFGFYGLRYGNTDEAQQLNLAVQATTGVSHQHSSYLAMSYYSGGMELFPDSGYVTTAPGSSYRYFSTPVYHHNTASAFESTGVSSTEDGAFFARPNVYAYDDGSKNGKQIQLIEGSNLMPDCNSDGFSNDYGVDVNRRMLIMIATDENHSYAVDIHRIKGSNVRESYLISSEEEDTELTTSLDGTESYSGKLTDWIRSKGKIGGSLLNANASYSGKFVNPIGSQSTSDFSFTWKGDTASVNAFVKGNKNSTIAFSQMPSVRRINNSSTIAASKTYETSSRHLYRRVDVPEGSDEVTTFASVYEGVKNGESAKISHVYWPNTGNDMTTSLRVSHKSGLTDYIYVSNDNTERSCGEFKMSGSVCIVRIDSAGNIVYSYIYGDGKISRGGELILQGKADLTYNVVSAGGSRPTDKTSDNYLVLDGVLTGETRGIWGSVNFSDGSGTALKVESVNGNTVNVANDPGFYMSGEKAVFTAYPMYEDISKPGRIAEWASPIPRDGTIVQRTRGDVTFTLKIPSFKTN